MPPNADAPVAASLSFRFAPDSDVRLENGQFAIGEDTLGKGVSAAIFAHDQAGAPTAAYRLSIHPVALPPRLLAQPADIVLEHSTKSATSDLAAAFAGEGLAYTLEAGPGAVTIDPASGLLTIATDAPFAAAEVRVLASNSGGEARAGFTVTVRERASTTVFDDAAALDRLTFIGTAEPSWTLEAGFARLVPHASARVHGDWANAAGDGLYRCLVRLGGANLPISLDRRFSFGARIRRSGSNWNGVRIETFETTAGDRRLHIREYTGASGVTNALATASVGWHYGVWSWLEVEILGSAIRARIHPEGAAAPDWQVSAETAQLAPGAFGPGGFPAMGAAPIIDLRRLEVAPAG